MQHRLFGAATLAVVVGLGLAWATALEARDVRPGEAGQNEGFEFWGDCTELPDSFEFLPVYLGGETPGFIDLGTDVVRVGASWRALQYTRDKDFGAVRARVGPWYGGMGADDWPTGTVDLHRQYAAFRVSTWEVDGTRYAVPADCRLVFTTESRTIGAWNVWIRFTSPGVHRVRVIGRQVRDFAFIYPFAAKGLSDPLGLDGRRIFTVGEQIGDAMDDEFVHTYEVHVDREDVGPRG
jgi:hypothetical protein